MTGSRIFERFEKEWTEISKILFATGLFLEKGVNFFLDPLAVERLVGLTRPPIHKTRDVLQIVDKVKQLKFSNQFFLILNTNFKDLKFEYSDWSTPQFNTSLSHKTHSFSASKIRHLKTNPSHVEFMTCGSDGVLLKSRAGAPRSDGFRGADSAQLKRSGPFVDMTC